MRVAELMKLLADAPADADVCFVNFKTSGYLRSVVEVEVDKIDDDPVVVLIAEDEPDDEG